MYKFIFAFLLFGSVAFAQSQETIPLTKAQTDTLKAAIVEYNEAQFIFNQARERLEKAALILDNRVLNIYAEKGIRRDEYIIDDKVENLIRKKK